MNDAYPAVLVCFSSSFYLVPEDKSREIRFRIPVFQGEDANRFPLFCEKTSSPHCIYPSDAVIETQFLKEDNSFSIHYSSHKSNLRFTVHLFCCTSDTPLLRLESAAARLEHSSACLHPLASPFPQDNNTVFTWAPNISSEFVDFGNSGRFKSAHATRGVGDWAAAKALPSFFPGDTVNVVITHCNCSGPYGSVVIGVDDPNYAVTGSASIPGKGPNGVGYSIAGLFLNDLSSAPLARLGDTVTFVRTLGAVIVLLNSSPIGKFMVLETAALLPIVALIDTGGVTLVSSARGQKL